LGPIPNPQSPIPIKNFYDYRLSATNLTNN
jgi:hypothetical protein